MRDFRTFDRVQGATSTSGPEWRGVLRQPRFHPPTHPDVLGGLGGGLLRSAQPKSKGIPMLAGVGARITPHTLGSASNGPVCMH